MVKIPLSRNEVALVDDIDAKRILKFQWYTHCGSTTYYAARKNHGQHQYMHRFLCGLIPGDARVVHHRDHDGLNNRRANLQVCTHAENDRFHSDSPAKLCGVYRTPKGRWQARIMRRPLYHYLGTFSTPRQAQSAVQKFLTEEKE